jgi:hypothetical protein
VPLTPGIPATGNKTVGDVKPKVIVPFVIGYGAVEEEIRLITLLGIAMPEIELEGE